MGSYLTPDPRISERERGFGPFFFGFTDVDTDGMNLLDAFKQYIRDAMPGGALNPEVTTQGVLDTAALGTAPVPILGDAIGLAADVRRLAKNPEERTPLNFTLAGLGALPFVPSGLAGMFVGKGSKTWDAISAAKAKELADKGVDARQIWKETGTFKGPDGHWRQEIPDNTSKMTLGRVKPDAYGAQEARVFEGAVKHGGLKRAYPELNQTTMTHWPDEAYRGANFNPAENTITMGQIAMKDPSRVDLHELQHVIQRKEGWAEGGNPTSAFGADIADALKKVRADRSALGIDPYAIQNRVSAKYPVDAATMEKYQTWQKLRDQEDGLLKSMASPEDAYKRLAGEAEARATQARMNLNAAQRRELFPLDSYDVPLDELIVRWSNN